MIWKIKLFNYNHIESNVRWLSFCMSQSHWQNEIFFVKCIYLILTKLNLTNYPLLYGEHFKYPACDCDGQHFNDFIIQWIFKPLSWKKLYRHGSLSCSLLVPLSLFYVFWENGYLVNVDSQSLNFFFSNWVFRSIRPLRKIYRIK